MATTQTTDSTSNSQIEDKDSMQLGSDNDVLAFIRTINTKKYTVLNETKQAIKSEVKIKSFISSVNRLLDKIDPALCKDETESQIIGMVLELIEHTFTDLKCGDLKKDIGTSLLKRYYKGDEELCGRIIEMVLKSGVVSKSTVFTRNSAKVVKIMNRIYKFFLGIVA